jgi:hypothetical protein
MYVIAYVWSKENCKSTARFHALEEFQLCVSGITGAHRGLLLYIKLVHGYFDM